MTITMKTLEQCRIVTQQGRSSWHSPYNQSNEKHLLHTQYLKMDFGVTCPWLLNWHLEQQMPIISQSQRFTDWLKCWSQVCNSSWNNKRERNYNLAQKVKLEHVGWTFKHGYDQYLALKGAKFGSCLPARHTHTHSGAQLVWPLSLGNISGHHLWHKILIWGIILKTFLYISSSFTATEQINTTAASYHLKPLKYSRTSS